MEITIKINTENANDMLVANRVIALISGEYKTEPSGKEADTVPEKPASKPRARKAAEKKADPVVETPNEAAPAEAPAGDMPFDKETEPAEQPTEQPANQSDEKPAEKQGPKVCTLQEWRDAYDKKRDELRVNDGQENVGLRAMFNDFVHRLSESYGDRLPSKLTDEKRGEFMKEFLSIVYSKAEGFHTTYVPF